MSALRDAGQELDIELMQCHEKAAEEIIDKIREAKRPVIVAGTGVRISDTVEDLQCLAESLNMPVTTAWTHDIFDNDHELFAGRPGTIGTRAGNFVVQNADLVLVLGSRLNIRQISYNLGSFASKAKLIWVDIDPAELKKPFPFRICVSRLTYLFSCLFWLRKLSRQNPAMTLKHGFFGVRT